MMDAASVTQTAETSGLVSAGSSLPGYADFGAILFGDLAAMWSKDYVDNPKVRLAQPTRLKYRTRLRSHILPRWKDVPVGQMRSKAILDWLHAECNSWYMMIDLRNIMSTIITKAQEWEILPDTFANPTRSEASCRER